MTKISELHKKWMEKPGYRQAYEEMRPEFELASANIFADLGLENAEELHARALIGCQVVKALKSLSQHEVAQLFEIDHAEVSHLMNGHFDQFTTEALLEFRARIDLDAEQ